jgi:secreted PhoX family phosphatase
MRWSRRSFLRTSLAGASGLFTPGGVDLALAAISNGPQLAAKGYGALVSDPDGLLDLPAGFRYQLLSTGITEDDRKTDARFDSPLSDGSPTPGLHDGMAAFAGPDGVTILVRNHELDTFHGPKVDVRRERPYDPLTGGGTTTLWVDPERRLVRSFASLSGTLRNCAGGPTPWGSWLSAEETNLMPGAEDPVNADLTPKVSKPHGYIFEVDSRSEGLVDPIPLKSMGRFRHEAVAVDPATGFAYLSEDLDDGLFYRFLPDAVRRGTKPSALRVGDYARGGVLEALRVKGRAKLKTQNWEHPEYAHVKSGHDESGGDAFRRRAFRRSAIELGESLAIDWVRIEDPDPDMDLTRTPDDPKRSRAAPSSTRAQGFALGCAQFARTEGITFANGSVYMCCTSGGPGKLGQVFRISLREQRLSLLTQPGDSSLLDGPDNLCAAPWGDLVVCEDNLSKRENFVVGVTPQGHCYRIARNAHPRKREFAGACFSPDGSTLFVNVQNPGLTFAIWGPWNSRRT